MSSSGPHQVAKMNLISSRKLDKTEKQVIYELTLKKRQSKKSTMSEKQLAAQRQLALELFHERRDNFVATSSDLVLSDPSRLVADQNSAIAGLQCGSPVASASCSALVERRNKVTKQGSVDSIATDTQSIEEQASSVGGADISRIFTTMSRCSTSSASTSSCNAPNRINSIEASSKNVSTQQPNQLAGGTLTESPSGSTCGGCSFTRSDSSYSDTSSNDSGTQMMIDDFVKQAELEERKKEANIKFNRTRLEFLNNELERRLYQYEYLVAREKALLGAYNMVLFTNEGVNNFHLHQSVSTPLFGSSSTAHQAGDTTASSTPTKSFTTGPKAAPATSPTTSPPSAIKTRSDTDVKDV